MLDHDQLLKDFEYRDGELYRRWKYRDNPQPPKLAGTINHHGRRMICYQYRMITAHRLIWFFFHKEWPTAIDHIDRNPLNNQIGNLRVCTAVENMANTDKRSDNTTGYKGVSFHSSRKKYLAQLIYDGKHYFLGRFDSAIEAAKAYDAAAEKYQGSWAVLNFPKVLDVI